MRSSASIEPTWTDWIANEYGNLASVVELAISLATLIVAARTQRVVERTRRRIFANLDATEGLSRTSIVEAHLAEMTAYLENLDWPFAVDRCLAALKSIEELRQNPLVLGDQQIALRRAIDDLHGVADTLEAKKRRHSETRIAKHMQEKIRTSAPLVANVKVRFQTTMREV